MESFETEILPPPATTLDGETARHWLADALPEYQRAMNEALCHHDQRVREAWHWIGIDLNVLTRACATALDGTPVEVELEEANEAEAAEITAALARALQARGCSDALGEAAFIALGELLAERLELATGSIRPAA